MTYRPGTCCRKTVYVLFMTLAVCALTACDGATGPRATRIVLSADTAAVVVGDSLVLTATVTDARGVPIPASEVTWFSSNPAITVSDGIVRATSGNTTARISAHSGRAGAEAYIIAEFRAVEAYIGLGARFLSPGAHFRVRPVFRTADSVVRQYAPLFPGAKAVRAVWSSDSSVVAWDSISYETANPGWVFVARGTGEADVSVSYGGVTETMRVVVQSPSLAQTDSIWTGQWNTCGLTATGMAWCRGSNLHGELGTRTAPWYSGCCVSYQQGSSVYLGVDTEHRFVKLVGTSYTFCGIATSQRVYCWGRGENYPLGGTAPKTDCARSTYPGSPSHGECSFLPIAVDRELTELLFFDDVRKTSQRIVLCGHVIARGASAASAVPVDEIWCWGSEYGRAPQRRPDWFQ